MTETTTSPHARYQDTHITSPLTPTRCHPTAHSQQLEALRELGVERASA
ncbi:hypothetical protein RKD26_000008 [Streptomyces calvus]